MAVADRRAASAAIISMPAASGRGGLLSRLRRTGGDVVVMGDFTMSMAQGLIERYGIDLAPKYVIGRIQKYKTINTPDGQKWMVKYDREWYLLGAPYL